MPPEQQPIKRSSAGCDAAARLALAHHRTTGGCAVCRRRDVALLVAPGFAAPLWSWQLTPLTARAIGAWLIGLGIAAAQVLREGDLMRVRNVQISSVAFVALQAIALARYPTVVSWSDPRLWGYLLFLASILAVSLYAWRATGLFRRL